MLHFSGVEPQLYYDWIAGLNVRDVSKQLGPDWHEQILKNGINWKMGSDSVVKFSAQREGPKRFSVMDYRDGKKGGAPIKESSPKLFPQRFVTRKQKSIDHLGLVLKIQKCRGRKTLYTDTVAVFTENLAGNLSFTSKYTKKI